MVGGGERMRKNVIILSIVLIAMFAGAASAANDINILPTIGDPNVAADGTINIPVGSDAYASVGLEVDYTNWPSTGNSNYQVYITDDSPGGGIVFDTGIQTFLISHAQPIHWLVPSDTTKTYTINANGRFAKLHASKDAPINPTPELSTGVLMSAGLIGLVGLTRYRRKE